MNGLLRKANFAGVIVLVTLCVAQWRQNSLLNRENIRSQEVNAALSTKFNGLEKTARGCSDDLESFRGQVVKAGLETSDTRERLNASDTRIRALEAGNDQLKSSLTNWMGAVSARDERLAEISARLATAAQERNKVITDFNALARKHAELGETLNQRIIQFNELAAKYNALVNPPSAAQPSPH